MTINEAIEKLNDLELKEFAYGHAMGVLYYDGDTVAPKKSVLPRGKTMGILSGEAYKLSTGEEAIRLQDYLNEHIDDLDPADRRRVELREKSLKEMRSISVEDYTAFAELTNDASAAWHEAKEKSDYSLFSPYLEKVIYYNRKFAELTEPDMDPYDYCLDKYEEGLNQKKCDEFFGTLREHIVPLVEKIKSSTQPETAFLSTHFPTDAQRKLSDKLMKVIGIDRERCNIGETEHPFTTDFSKYDVRITTHYHEDSFLSSMYSVIHEGGHALYELHMDDKLNFTSLNGGVSMGVHESQSRFFENILGRSKEFIEYIYPEITSLCPELAHYTPEQIYKAANKAEPSLIRTEADELTYSLHVMVRYEMEKSFMKGSVNMKELPDMWNALYKEYLGVDVPNDRAGILQDSHWSGGSIGYFPSYALGSAYGAQLLNKMQETVNVKDCLRTGDFAPINSWLENRIWKYGSMYKPAVLMEKAMEASFDPKYYTDYLERKIGDVYGF